MTEIMTIGLDLAKTVFQVHGADSDGVAVVRKKLRPERRSPWIEGLLARRPTNVVLVSSLWIKGRP